MRVWRHGKAVVAGLQGRCGGMATGLRRGCEGKRVERYFFWQQATGYAVGFGTA